MLTGILAQTDGIVEVDGVTPWRHREHNARQIGVVFGQRSALWWDLRYVTRSALSERCTVYRAMTTRIN